MEEFRPDAHPPRVPAEPASVLDGLGALVAAGRRGVALALDRGFGPGELEELAAIRGLLERAMAALGDVPRGSAFARGEKPSHRVERAVRP